MIQKSLKNRNNKYTKVLFRPENSTFTNFLQENICFYIPTIFTAAITKL